MPGRNIGRLFKISAALLTGLLLFGSVLALRKHGASPAFAGSAPGTPWDAQASYMAHFASLDRYGPVGPVHVVDPKSPGLSILPYATAINPAWQEAMAAANGDPRSYSLHDDPYPATYCNRVQSILNTHPHYFVAEAQLADYYRSIGNSVMAQRYLDAALRDAPCVLAGRLEMNDGTPVAGAKIMLMIRETPDLQSTSNTGHPTPALNYEVTTNNNGCYYLPVDHAYLRLVGIEWTPKPAQKALSGRYVPINTNDTDDYMAIAGKVGLLKPIVVRPYIDVTANGRPLGVVRHPRLIHGLSIKLAWKPYPGAVNYRIERMCCSETDGTGGGIYGIPDNPAYASGPNTSRTLDFLGTKPIYSRDHSYYVLVIAEDAGGHEVGRSRVGYFVPPDARFPLRSPKEAAGLLPRSWHAVSVSSNGWDETVTATRPHGDQGSPPLDQTSCSIAVSGRVKEGDQVTVTFGE